MENFVAIDVETANNYRTSICSIGAVKVKGGEIVDRFYEFVCPEPNFYFRHFTENIHGISCKDTDDARCFWEVWEDVEKFREGLPFVAHNKMFDEGCIRECFRMHRRDYPFYPFFCTLQTARKKIPRGMIGSYSLPVLADFLGIPFDNHHNALADAEACAKIAMALL